MNTATKVEVRCPHCRSVAVQFEARVAELLRYGCLSCWRSFYV